MKIINFKKAKERLSTVQQWTRVRPGDAHSPRVWRYVKRELINGLVEYQRCRLIRIAEAMTERDNRPA